MAKDKSASPNPAERTSARLLGRASYRASVAGIIIGAFICLLLIIYLIDKFTYKKESK